MKLILIAIYDSKVESFGMPYAFKSKGEALRAFIDECNNPQSNISKHAEDYTLFEIGEYDVATAKISPHVTPKSLGLAREFKKDS